MQVEIHACRTVLGHLHAGDQSAVEALEDQGVQDVRAGMELAHGSAKVGIDDRLDASRKFSLGVEQMPELARTDLEANHPGLAAVPAQDAAVGELPSSAWVERRFGERDLAGPGRCDGGLDDQRVGMFMAEEMHGSRLAPRPRRVLAKIAVGFRSAGSFRTSRTFR